MDINKQEKIISIITKLNSIIEILTILQLIDINLNEFKNFDIPDYLELPISALHDIKIQIENI